MHTESGKPSEHGKYLSFILRHSPQSIGLSLDNCGWALIEELIQKSASHNRRNLTDEIIKEIVRTDEKKRYMLSDDGKKIRACQGHSVKVDLQLEEKEPPEFLYHGTAGRFLKLIMVEGLKPMKRSHVHLSVTEETAISVGKRHGTPAILKINSIKMFEEGCKFYLAENGVWLTDFVPVKYIMQIK